MRGWWLSCVVIAACHSTPPPSPPHGDATQPAQTKPPARGRMVVTETHVEILDPIQFLSGSAALDPRSTPILDAIASTLNGNPSIELVAVHAYGADALVQFQSQVGAERALTIVEQLVARGVARSRLLAQGGATPPRGAGPGPNFEILKRSE